MEATAIVVSVGSPSLELAISVWLDAKARRSNSPETASAYAETLGAFRTALRAAGLDLDGEARAVALVAQAFAFRRADGVTSVAPATANQRLAILSSFYAFGARRGLLVDPHTGTTLANPINQVERAIVQPYAGARAITAADIAERMGAIDRTTLHGKRDYALLSLALQTGRRATELRSLARGDLEIQPARGSRPEQITVHFRRTKGGKVMQDRLAPGTAAALLDWLQCADDSGEDAPIFVSLSRSSRGHPLTRQGLANIWQARLGTSKVHATRHTFARSMEDAGAKVSEIQARLGHANLATTGRYLAALSSAENPYATILENLFGIQGKPF
jgi:integrase